MVRLILGVKGSGKTKQLIEMINNAAKDEPGSVVCIEADSAMMFDIHYQIRLIDAKEYQLGSKDAFRGFVSGLYAGNYDISHIFVDNLGKTINADSMQETEDLLHWMDTFGEKNNIKFTVTLSARTPRPSPRTSAASCKRQPRAPPVFRRGFLSFSGKCLFPSGWGLW